MGGRLFNAPCCHNGHTADKRQRGGVIQNDGGIPLIALTVVLKQVGNLDVMYPKLPNYSAMVRNTPDDLN